MPLPEWLAFQPRSYFLEPHPNLIYLELDFSDVIWSFHIFKNCHNCHNLLRNYPKISWKMNNLRNFFLFTITYTVYVILVLVYDILIYNGAVKSVHDFTIILKQAGPFDVWITLRQIIWNGMISVMMILVMTPAMICTVYIIVQLGHIQR